MIIIFVFDVNNFGPFDHEVWGSVADWFIFIATAITGWFIYKTFQAQLNLQYDQQEILKIEKAKHRLFLLPEFSIDSSPSPDIEGKIFPKITLLLNQNTAVSINLINQEGSNLDDILVNKKYDEKKAASKINIVQAMTVKPEDGYKLCFINVYFKDIEENSYIQELRGR